MELKKQLKRLCACLALVCIFAACTYEGDTISVIKGGGKEETDAFEVSRVFINRDGAQKCKHELRYDLILDTF